MKTLLANFAAALLSLCVAQRADAQLAWTSVVVIPAAQKTQTQWAACLPGELLSDDARIDARRLAAPSLTPAPAGLLPPDEQLHTAVCQAVSILNISTDVAQFAQGRQVHDILRQALWACADATAAQAATKPQVNDHA